MSTAPTSTRKAAAAKKLDVASEAVDPLDPAMIADLLAKAIRNIHEETSVTSLFV